MSASAGSSPDRCRAANHYSLPFAMLPTGTKRQTWTKQKVARATWAADVATLLPYLRWSLIVRIPM